MQTTLNNLKRFGGIALWSLACQSLAKLERKHYSATNQLSAFRSSLRVALVKQSTYCDLFSQPTADSLQSLIFSSWHRTGPVGLFTEFQAQFFIVHAESDIECRVWEEKKEYPTITSEKREIFKERFEKQHAVAVRAADVDWSKFDIVIAFENAVPAKITQRFPTVLWATLLEHHRMKPYRTYLQSPPAGYDAFLNLRYGPNPQSVFRKLHVIDWPYNFTAPGALRETLAQHLPPLNDKDDFAVLPEDNQPESLTRELSQNGFRVKTGRCGSLRDYLQSLLSADALLFPTPSRPLGGLAMLDAASAGVLLIGNPYCLWNPFLISPALITKNTQSTLEVLRRLQSDQEFRSKCRAEQDARLTWFGFHRPLAQLAKLVCLSSRPLSAREHITPTGNSQLG